MCPSLHLPSPQHPPKLQQELCSGPCCGGEGDAKGLSLKGQASLSTAPLFI